jgi:hypothetical protein
MYEILAFSIEKEYYCSLEKGNVGSNRAFFMVMFFVPKYWLVL